MVRTIPAVRAILLIPNYTLSRQVIRAVKISTLTLRCLVSKARFSVKSGQISHRTHLQTQLVSLTGKLSSSQSLPRDAMRKRGISRLPLSSSPSQLDIVSKRLNISIIHSFIRFFNENTVITQWFNNMQCIKHVVTSKCL